MAVRLKVAVSPAGALLIYDKKQLRKVLRQAGSEVAAQARRLIIGGSGRVYRGSGSSKYRPYKRGKYTASGPGQAPANVTGTLKRSISAKVSQSGQSVRVKATAFYALFLEFGAQGGGRGKASRNRRGKPVMSRVLAPRPFLTAALGAREASLGNRIRESIVQDIAFRKLK